MSSVPSEITPDQMIRQDCLHKAITVLSRAEQPPDAATVVDMADTLATWVRDGNPVFSLGTTTTTTKVTTTHTDDEETP